MRFSYLISAVTALIPRSSCWGEFGHRTVVYLAEKYFTPEAHAMVASLLEEGEKFEISDASLWADQIRDEREETKPWHYISVKSGSPETCNVDFERDCGTKENPVCVVTAIEESTKILVEGCGENRQREKEALMYLLHFIGDLLQPLHAEDTLRGGNDLSVCFEGQCKVCWKGNCGDMNLHAIWDTDIILKLRSLNREVTTEQEKEAAAAWAKGLYELQQEEGSTPEHECAWITEARGCALEWATESNSQICKYVLKDGIEALKNKDLSGNYYTGAAPVAEASIGRAGLILGAWLNAIAAVRSERSRLQTR